MYSDDNNKRNFIRLVDDNDIENIRDTAVKILCRSGFGIQNRAILEKLEKKGFKVDYNKQIIEVTPELFKIMEECARQTSITGDTSELISRRFGNYVKSKESSVLRKPVPKGFKLGRNITNIFDTTKGEKRLATLDDNDMMLKALHGMPEVAELAPLFTSGDIPPVVEPIVSLASAIKITDKPFSGIEVMMPGQLPYIEELHSIKEGGKAIKYTHSFSSITKFTLDSRAAACAVEVADRNGLEVWGSNSCPIAGMSAPVTVAGAVALGMAEMIGGWIPGWALNENVKVSSVPVSGILDMKTTRIMFAAPEAVLIDAVLNQVFNILYGLSLHPENTATYIDGKVPGFQAVQDKVFKSMSFLALTGCNIGSHFGMLESGASICPVQMMLDFDINHSMQRLARGIEVNPEKLALEVIDEVGVHGDFINTDHTYEHFRKDIWQPTLMDRTSFMNDIIELSREKEILKNAQDKYESAYRSYKPINISDEKIKAVNDVVRCAKKDLL